MIRKTYLGIVIGVFVAFVACNNDDDNPLPIEESPRDVATQTAADDARLVEFLKTHFYNYEDFENLEGNEEVPEIVFKKIDSTTEGKTSLYMQKGNQLKEITIPFLGIDHKIYVLKAREGAGETFSFADSVFVNYKGIALNEVVTAADSTKTEFQLGNTFDSAVSPVWFNPNGTIQGFMMGVNDFKATSSITLGDDGTLEPKDAYGIGAVFMPSFLAYYDNRDNLGALGAYRSLIFTFDMIAGRTLDHDNDGVPSKQEDANNNLILTDDDTDGDGIPDFLDEDTK